MAKGGGSQSQLMAGIASDNWMSVTSCVLSALVILHSWKLHGRRKWKSTRVQTELAALWTLIGGALLLIGKQPLLRHMPVAHQRAETHWVTTGVGSRAD